MPGAPEVSRGVAPDALHHRNLPFGRGGVEDWIRIPGDDLEPGESGQEGLDRCSFGLARPGKSRAVQRAGEDPLLARLDEDTKPHRSSMPRGPLPLGHARLIVSSRRRRSTRYRRPAARHPRFVASAAPGALARATRAGPAVGHG
jgi:hypothetical protein